MGVDHCLLLPKGALIKKIYEVKIQYEIPTHSYVVYVDDQPCNINDYNILMNGLVGSFEATKTAIEVRLRKLNLLTDNRKKYSIF